jgi:adenylate cyclase
LARSPQRKLATILMADVVGFSRLTRVDEPGTLAEFKRHLKDYIRPSIRRLNGRLVKTLGDGLLAAFDSPVNAVACALALHEGAARCNDAIPASRQLRFHIGLNLGDVVFEEDDVLGDAVNVAARLQDLAAPDAIVISDAIAEHVRGKLPIALEDMGDQQLKNIAEPIRAWRVLRSNRVPGVGAFDRPTLTPSIAVLPFLNMSGDPEQRYFSDGITEDIITELSRFRTISVIARTSSFIYRDKSVDVKQVADELNAQFVVEGSVRKLDDRVRITVQLVSAASRHHVWAEKYDAALLELFKVQDDVTRRIVATLVPRIEAEELETARKQPTAHMRAYDCYLRGKSLFYSAEDAESREAARRHFEQAITIDPEFARAYCFLAAIYNNLSMSQAAGTPVEPPRERAHQLALKAVFLDDSDPLTHLSLAWCHLWGREFDAAQKHLDIAAQLNPNDSEQAMLRGTALMYLGEPDAAIELMRTAMRLNPFHSDANRADLAEAYFVARRHEEMLAIAEQLPAASTQFIAWKAAGYAYAGDMKKARQHAESFVESVRAIWAGDRAAGAPEFIAWLLAFSPFRRASDAKYLVHGLELAGLTAQAPRETEPAGSHCGTTSS